MKNAIQKRPSQVIDAEFEDDPIVRRRTDPAPEYPDPPSGRALIITDRHVFTVLATDLLVTYDRNTPLCGTDGRVRGCHREHDTRIRLDAIVLEHETRLR
jgi:hypothetical protein